jgi:LPXTG-motif cell wall-anchored protein
MKRVMILACALGALAVAPSAAQAWTPEDCAAWYQEHGSNHPDCQSYVPPQTVCRDGQTVTIPADQVVGTDTPGECVVPPKLVTICRDGANTVTVPETEVGPTDVLGACAPPPPPPQDIQHPDMPDSDYIPPPIIVDDAPVDEPQSDVGTPEFVAGVEQTGDRPQVVSPAEATTLPYTGGGTSWLIVAGLGGLLLSGGLAARRVLQRGA